ncbi:hypothetical protein C2845_PM03G25640 [Panicum miliaceum]|uniref:Pentatricopeptide repeat-containing protein n=1 Tax=Panicum miliaceum TaxID=4540 RepID=A0A3L6TFW5_PANMI|nr:hypothetical protein C2845_PM03G25640 [Panicum miliaceum]
MSAAAALSPRPPPPPNPSAADRDDSVNSLLASLSDPSALRFLPAPLLAFSRLRLRLPPVATHLLLRPIASLLHLHRPDLRLGLQLHALSLSLGLSCHPLLLLRLVSFYSHHPSLLPAASSLAAGSTCPHPYNVLISACLSHGLPRHALAAYQEMVGKDAVAPDAFTYPSVLRACAEARDLALGRAVHVRAADASMDGHLFFQNALVSMYAKCGDLVAARRVFDGMGHRDVVSWNSMISGYAASGLWREAVDLFNRMRAEGAEVNSVTWNTIAGGFIQMRDYKAANGLIRDMVRGGAAVDFVTLVIGLNACSRAGWLRLGKEIHGLAVRMHCDGIESVSNAVITMYARCKDMERALMLFKMLRCPGLVTWNTMIAGFALSDDAEEASRLFREMVCSDVKPNYVTIVTYLALCARVANLQHGRELHTHIVKHGFKGHSGLVDEGEDLFDKMVNSFGIKPQMEHYSCMVDLYARAGLLEKAEELLNQTPFPPTSTMWAALVGACHERGNIVIGERSARRLLEMKTENAGHYVLVANMYAAAGCWNELATVRKLMRDLGATKAPGLAWADLGNGFTPFLVGDRSNPLAPEIYEVLDELTEQMRNIDDCSDLDILSTEKLME